MGMKKGYEFLTSLFIALKISVLLNHFLNNYPRATSNTIIILKPRAKAIVPIFECYPWLASGISYSTTT